MAEGIPVRERHIRSSERPVEPFATNFLGFETHNPLLKALDWRKRHRSDSHLVASMRSYVEDGVRSRRERFGELTGRLLSGYWREPQSQIHVHTPDLPTDDYSSDPRENWRRVFESSAISKSGYTHKLYALLDVPYVARDHKDRFDMIPDSVPPTERRLKAFFVRSELFDAPVLERMRGVAAAHQVPLIDIRTLSSF